MIDLRGIEPLKPIHAYIDPQNRKFTFSCTEMRRTADKFYQCADESCVLKYKHFVFVGYLKDPDLPYSIGTRLENILNKPMVCRPQCEFLKLNKVNGFYSCVSCGGNFMKHPECGFTSTVEDWLKQDPRVLRYLIKKAQDSSRDLREQAAENPDSEEWKILLMQLDEAEKIFFVNILSRCRL